MGTDGKQGCARERESAAAAEARAKLVPHVPLRHPSGTTSAHSPPTGLFGRVLPPRQRTSRALQAPPPGAPPDRPPRRSWRPRSRCLEQGPHRRSPLRGLRTARPIRPTRLVEISPLASRLLLALGEATRRGGALAMARRRARRGPGRPPGGGESSRRQRAGSRREARDAPAADGGRGSRKAHLIPWHECVYRSILTTSALLPERRGLRSFFGPSVPRRLCSPRFSWNKVGAERAKRANFLTFGYATSRPRRASGNSFRDRAALFVRG